MENKLSFTNKSGRAIILMSELLLELNVGDKVPTIGFMIEKFNVSRGTIQNTLSYFEENGLITLDKCGRNGTYLVQKNDKSLFGLLNIDHIWGVMPIPYTSRYEGLGTGIKQVLQKQLEINVSLSYMKNANEREQLLDQARVDFAIFSLAHAKEICSQRDELKVLCHFDDFSYLSSHILLSNVPINEIEVVGVDANSYTHSLLIEENLAGSKLRHIEFSKLKDELKKGNIDATILNEDDVILDEFPYTKSVMLDEEYYIACIVINEKRKQFSNLLSKKELIEDVIKTQKGVINGLVDPNY